MNLPLKLKWQTHLPLKPRPPTSTSTTSYLQSPKTYKVDFKTMEGCKLGISRYPYFDYNAQGGAGKGTGEDSSGTDLMVSFDPEAVFIPPMRSSTTRFLGLPLPPFLRIEIVPELFKGRIDKESGQVDLEFTARFLFSVGSVYRAPALLVATVLTSEEGRGETKSGRGRRLDGEGKCRLVGVARVDPIDDVFINTFLQLPTECIAVINAVISFSDQSS